MAYTAGDVMDLAASLLNDTAKSLYSYVVQIPFLKIAQDDLESELLDNSIVIENQIAEIDVAIAATFLTLPCNFFLPVQLWERAGSSTSDDDFILMEEKGWEPAIDPVDSLVYWAFRNNKINFVGALTARTVRLEYKRVLSGVVDEDSNEEVTKAKSFLAFRTAALCAEFIGRRPDIANGLNTQGIVSLDKLVSIYVKNAQGVRVRRKPFRVPRNRHMLIG